MEWDYIVVGGGSAGCALAARLSEEPTIKVLLLEAGGVDWSPYIHIPAAIIKAIGNKALDWCLMAEPDPSRGGKVDLWPAGRVLGGSSSINGMLFVRGQHQDYDEWASLGCPGWAWSDVAPVFKRLETATMGSDQWRGRTGPQRVEAIRTRHPIADIFHEAAQACGIPENPDYNGASQEGVAQPQVTQKGGRRFSASRAYLWPARSRANLKIMTNAQVIRLLIEDGACRGVALRRPDGSTVTERAAGEVILTAGTLGSAKLLMLSGVGPGADLARHGIAVRQDRPAVGQNLQEHPNYMISMEVANTRTYNVEIGSVRTPLHLARWLAFGRGPVASGYSHACGFFRSEPGLDRPDLQLMFGPYAFTFDERGVHPYPRPAVSSTVAVLRPHNRGRIALRGADPTAPIRIEHALLADDRDVATLVRGGKLMRRILGAAPFAPYRVKEIMPGAATQDDAAWERHVRETAYLGYHPVGTCRMGTDEQAVVAPDLTVNGIAKLRVADVSVLPRIISANTNAAAMMIGERASDLLKAARLGVVQPGLAA